MPTLFSFALRNIRRKPLRTGILVFAISLLVAALVFSLSLVVRVNSSIKKSSERLGADLLIVPTGSRGAAEEVLLENSVKSFYMDRSVMEKVRKIDGIDKLTEQTYLVTLTGLCCSVPQSLVVAFNQDTDFIVTPWLAKKVEHRLKRGEAIAGHESAFNISLGLVEVDSMLFGTVFRMVGKLEKTGTGLDTAVFVSDENMDDIIRNGKASVRPGQISVIFVRVKPGVDPMQVARAVEDSIIEADAVARRDIGKRIIATLRDMSSIFTITIVLASVLSLLLVWAIFTAIANERAKEVGIMRAIGAKERHVLRLFLGEVLIVAATGSVLGIVVGTVLSATLAETFSIVKHLSSSLTAVERAAVALASFAAGAVICVLGALVPVQRIKKMEPLAVLKGE
jgi:putative ABC transport system permease protein